MVSKMTWGQLLSPARQGRPTVDWTNLCGFGATRLPEPCPGTLRNVRVERHESLLCISIGSVVIAVAPPPFVQYAKVR